MDANAVVARGPGWQFEAWQGRRYSSLPTLAGTAATLLAVLALWLSANGGWPVLTPDFASPPPVAGEAPEIPSPPSFREAEREQRPLAPSYFLVATAAQASQAEAWLALAAAEQANGVASYTGGLRLLRWVDSPEAERFVLEEVAIATESWAATGQSVAVLDLR